MFLVVCRTTPYAWEAQLKVESIREVSPTEPFKGRVLKAAESASRAIIAVSDNLVLSGWMESEEFSTLLKRYDSGDLDLLAIRIGDAPCARIPRKVPLLEDIEPTLSITRWLAGHTVTARRPVTADFAATTDIAAWETFASRVQRGDSIPDAAASLSIPTKTLEVGAFLTERFRLLKARESDGLFASWVVRDLKEHCDGTLHILHPHEAHRTEELLLATSAWQKLTHPFIARCFGSGTLPDGRAWFVAEQGAHTLAEAVAEDTTSSEQILLHVLDLCDALSYAHAKGEAHGAVDPTRIRVHADHHAMLTDFGVARITGTSREAVVYAAPENLSPNAPATPENDVYGLAMITLLGIHGKPLPYWVMRDATRLLDEHNICEQLDQVLRRALDWDPQARPQSITQLQDAILHDIPLCAKLADLALAERRFERLEALLDTLGRTPAGEAHVARLRLGLARARASEGAPEEAITALTEIAESTKDNAAIWLEIAQIHHNTGNTDGLILTAERALDTHRTRDQALQALRFLVEADPARFPRWGRTLALYAGESERGATAWKLGQYFFGEGNTSGALLWLDRAAEAGVTNPDLREMQQSIRASRGDWTDVVALLMRQAAEDKSPQEKIELLERAAGIAQKATPHPEPVVDIYEKLIQIEPQHLPALRYLSRHAARMGAVEQSLSYAQRLCSSEHALPSDHAARARRLLAQGDWKQAKQCAEAGLSLEPNHVVALRVAGRAAQEGGLFAEAAAHRARLIALQSTGEGSPHADRLAQLGDLYRLDGQPELAAGHYDQALAVDGNHLGAWWSFYLIERARLADHDNPPPAPLRFGPHEALARLLADLLEANSIEQAIRTDPYGTALAQTVDWDIPWRAAAAAVELLQYREAIGAHLFERLASAFPLRSTEIAAVGGLWSGMVGQTTFPVLEALQWSDDGPDFDAELHRELLFCRSWPGEAALDDEFWDTLLHRTEPLTPHTDHTDDDDEEDLLLESPEIPVLKIRTRSSVQVVPIEDTAVLSPEDIPVLPGNLAVFRQGDQIYLAVEHGLLELHGVQAEEFRVHGGDELTWGELSLLFDRVEEIQELPGDTVETTQELPLDASQVPGAMSSRSSDLLGDTVPALMIDNGTRGVPLTEDLSIVPLADGSLVFTPLAHPRQVARVLRHDHDVVVEEMSRESDTSTRRTLQPGERLQIGNHLLVYRTPDDAPAAKSLPMPKPSLTRQTPMLTLYEGTPDQRIIHVSTKVFRLGRGRRCELQIRTDGLLSRVHCEITDRPDGFYLSDAGSSNGTRLNDVDIEEPVKLKNGDLIEIGRTEVRFTISATATVPETTPAPEDLERSEAETLLFDPLVAEAALKAAAQEPIIHDEIHQKITVTNRAIAVLAQALDAEAGSGRGLAELQLLIDGYAQQKVRIFEGIELDEASLPSSLIEERLADRSVSEQRQVLNRVLLGLIDKFTNIVCDALPEDEIDSVLSDLSAIRVRHHLRL